MNTSRPDPLQLPETGYFRDPRRAALLELDLAIARVRLRRMRRVVVLAVLVAFAGGVLAGRVSASWSAQQPVVVAGPAEAPKGAVHSRPAPRVGQPEEPSGTVDGPSPAPHILAGLATWYAGARGHAAAGPALRAWLGPRWRGRYVLACGAACVRIRLTDWCACADRHGLPTLVDLSNTDFAELGPLSRGVLAVVIHG